MSYGFHYITLYYYSEKEKEQAFAIRQNLVSAIYVDFLNENKPKGTTRISVTIGDEDQIIGYFGSILSANAAINEREYWAGDSAKQNQMLLDTIHRIAILCADQYKWEKAIFERAYRKVIESSFIFKKELKKKFSKDRKHQASIVIEKDGRSATISVCFYDKNGLLIKTTELFKPFHSDWFYRKIVNRNKWFNNNEFGIYSKNEELTIKASIENLSSEILITPEKNTKEELESYLRQITFKELNSEADYLKWVNK